MSFSTLIGDFTLSFHSVSLLLSSLLMASFGGWLEMKLLNWFVSPVVVVLFNELFKFHVLNFVAKLGIVN